MPKKSEFALIDSLQSWLGVKAQDLLVGMGDDCAVIKNADDGVWLVSNDACVANQHFLPSCFSDAEVGHKALASALSDIAAMGGAPRFALIGLALAPGDQSKVSALYEGIHSVAKQHSVAVIGGNITQASELSLTTTVIGEAKRGAFRLRSQAQVGDVIWYAGYPGYAHVGWQMLLRQTQSDNEFVRAQKMPNALCDWGQWLAQLTSVHALIDVSDGILQDAAHVARASHATIHIDSKSFSYTPEFQSACAQLDLDPVCTTLTGGEDYGLLFTASAAFLDDYERVPQNLKAVSLTRVGVVSAQQTDDLVSLDGASPPVHWRLGWEHVS